MIANPSADALVDKTALDYRQLLVIARELKDQFEEVCKRYDEFIIPAILKESNLVSKDQKAYATSRTGKPDDDQQNIAVPEGGIVQTK
jgi:hypothetical protein